MRRLVFFALIGLFGFGCTQSNFGDPLADGDPNRPDNGDTTEPGDAARQDAQVDCASDDECRDGETCIDAVCQLARCNDGPYLSAPPLPGGLRLALDREFIVADTVATDGEYYVDGYPPKPGAIDYSGSWSLGETRPTDVVGGSFDDADAESFVAGTADGNALIVGGGPNARRLEIGFAPASVAAGDLDGDGLDEAVALGQFGNVAICNVDEDTCKTFAFTEAIGLDVAIGDVDADGVAEAVFLVERDQVMLHVWQSADEAGGAVDEPVEVPAGVPITRLDLGDLDGDGIIELVGLQPSTLTDTARLHVLSLADGAVAALDSRDTNAASRDVAVSDTDRDDASEVVVLREGAEIELLSLSDGGALLPVLTHELQVSIDPLRISASDFDADSPRLRLMDDEARLLPGPVTPVTVAHFPPYNAEHSETESKLIAGNATATGQSQSDTVSLSSAVELGVGVDVFGLFQAGLSTRIKAAVSKSFTEGTTLRVGTRVSAEANPAYAGHDYGLVVLSCSCFHSYEYEVVDPAGHMDAEANGAPFVLVLPVGGTTAVWSSKRYNAMAERVDGLPMVEIPYTLGDPTSYPTGPQRAGGDPIASDDFVFPEVPNLLVSDIASVSARLSVKETETTETSRSVSLDVGAELGVGPFKFGATLGAGWGESHKISIGEEALFGGSVPPIVGNPDTPEDEYLEHAFSFSPYVFREHYVDAQGNDAAYYVISWAVSSPG